MARNLNLSQCISESLHLEMERDHSVLVIGEDVGMQGGVFGATRGLQKKFGATRVIDTPISESAITGMGVGLAIEGYRPVLEIMFVDFIGVCLDQVYNAIAKNHYMSGGQIRMPIVIKTAGGCIGSGAQHSQCLWGLFAHLPGLKVVAPSNPYDAKGLMASAVESDDPVVYIEHKGLLLKRAEDFSFGSDVPEGRYTIPLGKGNIVHPGSDLTIVTLSGTVSLCVNVARALAEKGISIEVIDLRSVVPLDIDLVRDSVAKTNRLLVVDEDYLSFGLSAEIITRVIESGINPKAIRRHAVPDVPIPGALTLEREILPSESSITDVVLEMMEAK
ncbi:MAG: alpha-ketoacid dehydrogenase subunit beta [Bacteroidota bacterium]|jgi:pyruvate/2-oxoglutarate/acetoin dehydrogenase E1 component